jgi:hypothetical protein
MRPFIVCFFVLFLAACPSTNTDELSLFKRVALACDSYSGGLKTMAVLRAGGKLSATDIKIVDGVIAVAAPICENPVRPKATLDLVANLENTVFKLLTLIEGRN